jgi:DNA-binding IclR family transcriptional regulator
MPRLSNPTGRTIRLLDLLASRPKESFGLSDLARTLQMNKTTCLTVLTTLVASGYVLLDPTTKTYCLGPGSVALGAAALRRFPAIEGMGEGMRVLSEELELSVTGVALAANQLVLVANHAPSDPLSALTPVGQRSPYAPPLGLEFAAWADPTEFNRWLQRGDPPLSAIEIEAQREAIAFIRSCGYSIALKTAAADQLNLLALEPSLDALRARDALVSTIMAQLRGAGEQYLLTSVQRSTSYPVLTISAPVFGADDQPCLSLVVSGFRWDLDAQAIKATAERLLSHTQHLSVALGARSKRFRRLQPTT